jgi:hypothetical protein
VIKVYGKSADDFIRESPMPQKTSQPHLYVDSSAGDGGDAFSFPLVHASPKSHCACNSRIFISLQNLGGQ